MTREAMSPGDPASELVRARAERDGFATENARLRSQVRSAHERESATTAVLAAISDSGFDLRPMFDRMLGEAARICHAEYATLYLYMPQGGDEDIAATIERGQVAGLVVASHNLPERARASNEEVAPQIVDAVRQGMPLAELARSSLAVRVVHERRTIHVPDISQDGGLAHAGVYQTLGVRAVLGIPMRRRDKQRGVITLWKKDAGPFDASAIALVERFADQAIIAIENVRLFNETNEALAQQIAVSDVLGTISRSAFDLRAVMNTIVERAAALIAGETALIAQREGDELVTLASYGPYRTGAWEPAGRLPIDETTIMGRAAITGARQYIPDATKDPQLPQDGPRTRLCIPFVRDGTVTGVLGVSRDERGPFTEREIRLLEVFADQAAIAIENVRLFNETKEALEQQTAIAEVLKTVSRSAFDLSAVLDTVVENTARLADADFAWLARTLGGDLYRVVSHAGEAFARPEVEAMWSSVTARRISGSGSLMGLLLRERRAIDIPDAKSDQELFAGSPLIQATGARTVLAIPMMRDAVLLGGMVVGRSEVRPFSPREIALAQTFADQAAIAIENVRLFNETKEALEQQTAIASILRVISESPTDVQPVLDAIAESASRYAAAEDAAVILARDGALVATSHHGPIPMPLTTPIDRSSATGHAVVDRRTVHVPDVTSTDAYPTSAENARRTGQRALLATPLIRGADTIGAILLRRLDPQPFTPRQIELVETFAQQAAIAIENVRLFTETASSLERQTATAEVLKAIGDMAFDLPRVLDIVISHATRLSDAEAGFVYQVDGEFLRMSAAFGERAHEMRVWQQEHPIRTDYTGSATGRAFVERRTVHIPDVDDDPTYTYREARELGHFRTLLSVPLLQDDRAIGVIALWRTVARPFAAEQIGLIETFADQAVIAMQNARLFQEIQQKSRELEAANRHKSEFLANMSHELRTPLNAVNGFSEVLLQGMFGDVNPKQREYLEDILSSGKHLLSLINDILDLSKIEAGRMELDLTTFSLASALDSGLTIVRERASRHGIRLDAVVPDGLPPVEADERKVKQILYNLLSNAVKFTPDGGKVEVRVRREDDDVLVEVRDTGIGIAAEDQARVFEEFQQVGRERSREGTGLGLTLTKRFVELHGGRIWVESEPGTGSTFSFTLPLHRKAEVSG